MTTSKRLAAFRAAEPKDEPVETDPTRSIKDEEDETPADQKEGSKKKEKPMAETVPVEQTDEYKAGVKASNERMSTVFASEHYEGREAAAAKLLGKNMTAEDIIDVLADMPKVERTALSEEQQREAAEEAGRKDMKAAIEETKNSGIDPGGSDAGGDKPKQSAKDRILAAQQAFGGGKRKTN